MSDIKSGTIINDLIAGAGEKAWQCGHGDCVSPSPDPGDGKDPMLV